MKVNSRNSKINAFYATKEATIPKSPKYGGLYRLLKKNLSLHATIKKLSSIEVKVPTAKEKKESILLKKIIKYVKKPLTAHN